MGFWLVRGPVVGCDEDRDGNGFRAIGRLFWVVIFGFDDNVDAVKG